MTLDAWVEAHAYLRPIARLSAQVEAALSSIDIAGADVPNWDDYASDFHEGVPLLQSSDAAVELESAGAMTVALVRKLSVSSLAGTPANDLRELSHELSRELDASRRVVDALLGDETFATTAPGLLRYLGWTAMTRYLRPVVAAFESWRNEERWQRSRCPTCGSTPAMAQLVGFDPGRLRRLVCGRCATRWQYLRTGCPFCESDSQRLAVIAVEGDARLRIDSCESCRGYLKTYVGQGEERVFLADWTSLHLDVIAQERGLIRAAVSLFELEAPPRE
jgi:FdhE protein